MDEKSFAISAETLLTTARFRVERVTHRFLDGRSHSRAIVRHPGAVVVLPLLHDGRICLIRNFRIALEQELLELPAGTLEPGEPPIETARRELTEETGYRCRELTPLCQFYMSPGILDERMYAFVATGLVEGPPARESGEQITNHLVDASEIDELLKHGKIVDSKSISTLLFHMRYGVK